MLGATFATDLAKLIFQNIALALLGDSSGLQPSATAGNIYVALHSADPGLAGDQTTSEVAYTGYSRYAVPRDNTKWTVSGSGPVQIVNALTLLFPTCTGGSDVARWFSLGCAGTSTGKIIARGPLVATWYDFTGTATDDTVFAPSSAFSIDDLVVFMADEDGTLPTGIVAGTVYFVKAVTADKFTIAATSGGTAIDLTADGAGIVGKIAPLAISNAVTPQFSASQLIATIL
jgi:hypothetical protein